MSTVFTDVKFLGPLYLRRDPEGHGEDIFVVDQFYCIRLTRKNGIHIMLCVNREFGTDLASVPRWARWAVSKVDGIEASVVHDWMYVTRALPRAEADAAFKAILKASGVGRIKRNIMYAAVRAGGGFLWSQRDKEFEIE